MDPTPLPTTEMSQRIRSQGDCSREHKMALRIHGRKAETPWIALLPRCANLINCLNEDSIVFGLRLASAFPCSLQ